MMLQRLFTMRLANLIDHKSVLINVDEITFSKSTKSCYSWLDRGISWSRANISFKGSISLIWAITSTGSWYVTNLTSHNNAQTFTEFIQKLGMWVIEDLKADINKVILLLDNCPIHKSKKSMDSLGSIGWKTLFLAPYSPEWAPIELLFNTLKKRLIKHSKSQIINLGKEEGFKNIQEWLATFTKKEIQSYWKETINTISSLLSI